VPFFLFLLSFVDPSFSVLTFAAITPAISLPRFFLCSALPPIILYFFFLGPYPSSPFFSEKTSSITAQSFRASSASLFSSRSRLPRSYVSFPRLGIRSAFLMQVSTKPLASFSFPPSRCALRYLLFLVRTSKEASSVPPPPFVSELALADFDPLHRGLTIRFYRRPALPYWQMAHFLAALSKTRLLQGDGREEHPVPFPPLTSCLWADSFREQQRRLNK